ncbi:RTase [Symbiodinium sp. CCMP2456]|nr:RTase [Symbiodinium sp. CCMP2456]
MTFRSYAGRNRNRQPGVSDRHLYSRCNIGFLNVCTLRHSFDIHSDGSVSSVGDTELEVLKHRMRDHHLYALALSEVRLPGSGQVAVGDGFVVLFAGSQGDGSQGGVGLLLSPPAVIAWRAAGSKCKAWPGGRLLHATFGLGGSEGVWHLASVYGPTMQCDESVKDAFYSSLSSFWASIPNREVAFAVGDYNARVGYRSRAGGLIDLAVGRQADFPFVLDTHALPGAEVESDHKLMVLRLRACPRRSVTASVSSNFGPVTPGTSRPARLDVRSLQDPRVSRTFSSELHARFTELQEPLTFVSLPTMLRQAAESTLRPTATSASDWRAGHTDQLALLAQRRQAAFTSWRADPTNPALLQALQQARSANRAEVRRFKTQWWQQQCQRLEGAVRSRQAYQLFDDARRLGRLAKGRGLFVSSLGSTHTTEEVTEHFTRVLNVARPVSAATMAAVPAVDINLEASHWDPPSFDEMCTAIRSLATGKTTDSSGVQAEMLKCLDPSCAQDRLILTAVHSLVCDFWNGRTPDEDLRKWHESLLFVLYKGKGGVETLENFRGVVSLDIVSKLVSRLLNNKLVAVVEQVADETELGYRRGRGVTDAVFCARRVIESWRFSNPDAAGAPDALYLLFIDLKKAFDAVPREEMFSLLSRCLHLPSHVIGMLRSLHEGMTTSHCHSGHVGPPINMSTGVRQGSVEGPTLYLLYYSLLLKDFRTRCAARFPDPVGVPWVTNRDAIFRIPSKVRRAAYTTVQLHGATYADDSLIFDTDWDRFSRMVSILDDCLRDWGAELNKVKTEWMEIPSLSSPIQGLGLPAFAADDAAPLPGTRVLYANGIALPKTGCFKYLGGWLGIDYTLGTSLDVSSRIGQANAAFGQLTHVWRSRQISRESSPVSKKSKSDAGSSAKTPPEVSSANAAPSRQHVQPLSCAELTRGYLDHDYQLRQLQASSTVVYRFEESSAFSQLCLSAVRLWQSKHKAGVAHPYGACSTAVASAVLVELAKDDECPEPLRVLLDAMVSGDMVNVAREVSLCTARLNAKKTFMIMEFRAHAASPLMAYLPTIQLFLAKQGGERLGMRPAGALARKAGGRSLQ